MPTRLSDIIEPTTFAAYVKNRTAEKSEIIASGAMVADEELSTSLAGGGRTFDAPHFRDLDNDEEHVVTDDSPEEYSDGVAGPDPKKISTFDEVAVRMYRAQSWGSSVLAGVLAGADPMSAIGDLVADYWRRRLQVATIAAVRGVMADNAAAPVGSEHEQGDLTNDVSGSSYSAGTTNFTLSALYDTQQTAGDAMSMLKLLLVHSVVYTTMKKNNLIDFVRESDQTPEIPTIGGMRVVVDDGMPRVGNVYESWLFGPAAIRFGQSAPPNAVTTSFKDGAGNLGGMDVLYNRVQWCIHPRGHSYVGTAPKGGPSNDATTNNLAAAGSWQRVYPERKQIPIARLITREA